MTVALTIGLLDVLAFHADAIKAQGTVSAGIDLALGLFLLAAGALAARGRRKAPVPAGDQQPGTPEKKDSWAERALSKPPARAGHAGRRADRHPRRQLLTALHILVTGKSSTATQVLAVVVFVIIDFLLILIPSCAFLEMTQRPPRRC